MDRAFLEGLGGEEGCKRLSAEFYARVGADSALRRLFPGKSLRCASEAFASFLIQFLGGDEEKAQHRWWLSLRESHSRFRIGPAEHGAWLRHMNAALEATRLDETIRRELGDFFLQSSAYLVTGESSQPRNQELAQRWATQRALDDAIVAIADGRDQVVLSFAGQLGHRRSVFVGLSARMIQSSRGNLIRFVSGAVEQDPSLALARYGGKTLLHFASGAGCIPVVESLLRVGANPDLEDRGEHTALYCLANECLAESGPDLVRILVRAGADVNACGGVTRATPLHMAARRGSVQIAQALLDCGAQIDWRDSKGDTPLQRAMNCRKVKVVQLLMAAGARRIPKQTFR